MSTLATAVHIRQALRCRHEYPKSVALATDGALWVGSNGYAGGLACYRPDVTGRYQLATSLEPGRLRGLCALPAGGVCASLLHEIGAVSIRRYDADVHELASWGRQGGEPGELCNPCGLVAGDDGQFFVLDCTEWNGCRALERNRVQVFTLAGEYLYGWGETGEEPGCFNLPIGICRDHQGRVLVADSYNHRVQVFAEDGELLAAWGTLGTAPGQLNTPQGIAADEAGRIWIADTHNDRVQCFAAGGRHLFCWGGRDQEPGLWLPCGIAVANGTLVVADTMNHRVLVCEVCV